MKIGATLYCILVAVITLCGFGYGTTPQISGHPTPRIAKKVGVADSQYGQQSYDKQQTSQTAETNAIVAAIRENTQERAKESEQEAAVESENVHLQRWLIGVGIAQAAALILTIVFIWYQAVETRNAAEASRDSVQAIREQAAIMERQTKAAEDTAKSALLNAQAVINSERPWVSFFATHSQGVYTFRAANMGRTPAEIISYSKNVIFADPSALTSEPKYGTEIVPPLTILAPGKGLNDQNLELATYDVASLITNNPDHAISLIAGKEAIILLFRIFYRSTLAQLTSIPYETRMCFVWRPNSPPEVGGPTQYNRHT